MAHVEAGASTRWAPSAAVSATLAATGVGLVVTALTAGTSVVSFGVRSPSAHLVLNSLDACVGLLVTFLLYLRFRRSHRAQDLLLAEGFGLLVVAGLGLASVPEVAGATPAGSLDVWLPLSVRVLGACALLAASALPTGLLLTGSRLRVGWLPPAAMVLAAGVLVVLAAGGRLPVALDLSAAPSTAQHPLFTGHWALQGALSLTAVFLFVGAVMFTRRAARHHDALLAVLGPAFALGGFARVNYVLFPSVYTDWLYAGDLLRSACYLLLLLGAAREIQHHWASQAELAVLEDRRRLARELHDGVIQELGFIRAQARRELAETDLGHRILAACQRALDESRAAVHALGSSTDEPLAAMLERAAHQLAERSGVELDLRLDDSVAVSSEQRHALVRILRESLTNASRHGRARRVAVALSGSGAGGQLTVADDGVGFDAESRPDGAGLRGGYGLVSMRDRARGLPGTLEIESVQGAGTTVRVRW